MESKGPYVVRVNNSQFKVELPVLTAAQIRALAAVPADYVLVVENVGTEDRLLADGDTVSLVDGPVTVFTVPPTTFG